MNRNNKKKRFESRSSSAFRLVWTKSTSFVGDAIKVLWERLEPLCSRLFTPSSFWNRLEVTNNWFREIKNKDSTLKIGKWLRSTSTNSHFDVSWKKKEFETKNDQVSWKILRLMLCFLFVPEWGRSCENPVDRGTKTRRLEHGTLARASVVVVVAVVAVVAVVVVGSSRGIFMFQPFSLSALVLEKQQQQQQQKNEKKKMKK